MRHVLVGTAAGALGTVALDVVGYVDMVMRGRAPSEMPAALVKKLAEARHLEPLVADDPAASNRRSAVGALLGYANGVMLGALYGAVPPAVRAKVPPLVAGLALGAVAMALSDVPATKTGVTNPTEWGISGWLADIIPHVVYGITVALAVDALDEPW